MDLTFKIPRRDYQYSKFISSTWTSKKAKYVVDNKDSIIIVINDLITCKPLAIQVSEHQLKLIIKKLIDTPITSPIVISQMTNPMSNAKNYIKVKRLWNWVYRFSKPVVKGNINWNLYGEPLTNTDTRVFADSKFIQLVNSGDLNKTVLIERNQLLNVILTIVLEGHLTHDYLKCIRIADSKLIEKVRHSIVAYKEHLLFRSSRGLYIIHESIAFKQAETRNEYTTVKGEKFVIEFKKLDIKTASDVPLNFLQPADFVNQLIVWKSVVIENEVAVLNLNNDFIFEEKEVTV